MRCLKSPTNLADDWMNYEKKGKPPKKMKRILIELTEEDLNDLFDYLGRLVAALEKLEPRAVDDEEPNDERH